MAGYHVAPGSRLWLCGRGRLRSDAAGAAGTVLGQIDGQTTIRDLAWRNGLALYVVMSWVVRLIQDGVCAVEGRPARRTPARVPRYPDGTVVQWTPPEPEVLERVLAGLRRLI